MAATADDTKILSDLNLQFIDAFRKGSWALLEPILSPGFGFLNGRTGEVWDLPRYIKNMDGNPEPTLQIDQVAIHVDGDVAAVSARCFETPGRCSRYVDTYARRGDGWVCVHACVWPVP